MTSKSRKRTQSRRDIESNLSDQGRKESDNPTPIAPGQGSKYKMDEDDSDDGKAHLGKNKRPDLIGTRPCERFLNGHCNFGKDCWFVHDVEARDAALAKSAGNVSPASGGIQLKIGNDDEPPKPKISLAPTNPWGRKEEDFAAETAGELGDRSDTVASHNELSYQMNRLDESHGKAKPGVVHSRKYCDSSLPPATPSTNPALGVFSVVDMLANVRTTLFEDAINRGVYLSCAPRPLHDRSEANVTSN